MKLMCKDSSKGSITFFTKGKYALEVLVGTILLMMSQILYWIVIIIMRL